MFRVYFIKVELRKMLMDLWHVRKRIKEDFRIFALNSFVIGVFQDGENKAEGGLLKFESSIVAISHMRHT